MLSVEALNSGGPIASTLCTMLPSLTMHQKRPVKDAVILDEQFGGNDGKR